MAQPKSNRPRFLGVVLETFGWPMFWGLALTVGFFLAIQQQLIRNPLIVRYAAGHPVEYVEVALFFVGLVAILRRGMRAVLEFSVTDEVKLPPAPAEGHAPRDATGLIAHMASLPRAVRQSTLGRRVEAALAYVRREDSADGLDDELKYLADLDADRTHQGYGLVRMIIWATPMLGFLGTVIGITMALGDLSPETLVNSPKEAMEGLLAGLSVAFDTTALALTLSIVLMFAQFLTGQLETQLLSIVDLRASEILGRRFSRFGTDRDPHLASVERMSQTVLSGMETLVKRHAEVWHASLNGAHQQWSKLIQSTGATVESAVAGAINQSLQTHSTNLMKLEHAAEQRAAEQWRQLKLASDDAAKQARAQQAEMTRHGEILLKVLAAIGQVDQLEQALNRNLRALAGAKNFEDTVMSLSAAIHLLSSRLGKPHSKENQVRLEADAQERAA